MAKLYVKAQASSNRSEYIFIQDSTSTSGQGKTGITFNASGLTAYYVKPGENPVGITLVSQTSNGAWVSGGFAEVNSSTMPGLYRIDIPNAVFSAGYDHVNVMIRGVANTYPVLIEYQLTGYDPNTTWLSTSDTASAVWNSATSTYTANGTFGLNLLRADQQNKQGLVTVSSAGNVNRVDADVHAIANDIAAATALKGALNHDGTGYVDSDVVRISTSTAAANELEGALLHNGTDYIDSNLIDGNSTRVFVGRFQLTQTGTTQGDIIEAFTTDTPSFELQLFDGDNNIVPVTGATLGLRILDVTSTVVETGTPTIEYGTGGIVRWTAPGSYVSIGCPAGMYRLFVDRTVSGTTTTFGPLQIKVQVQ